MAGEEGDEVCEGVGESVGYAAEGILGWHFRDCGWSICGGRLNGWCVCAGGVYFVVWFWLRG